MQCVTLNMPRATRWRRRGAPGAHTGRTACRALAPCTLCTPAPRRSPEHRRRRRACRCCRAIPCSWGTLCERRQLLPLKAEPAPAPLEARAAGPATARSQSRGPVPMQRIQRPARWLGAWPFLSARVARPLLQKLRGPGTRCTSWLGTHLTEDSMQEGLRRLDERARTGLAERK